MEDKCEFDKEGICHAMACYSAFKCNARDKDGNPKYADINECKRYKLK